MKLKEAKKSKSGTADHSTWRNYDDLNEYFWSEFNLVYLSVYLCVCVRVCVYIAACDLSLASNELGS